MSIMYVPITLLFVLQPVIYFEIRLSIDSYFKAESKRVSCTWKHLFFCKHKEKGDKTWYVLRQLCNRKEIT